MYLCHANNCRDPVARFSPEHSRDYERTPMQWNGSANADFTIPEATTWLPIASDYQAYNVEVEQQDSHSMLALTHGLLKLRQSVPALTIGAYASVDQENDACFAYLRQQGEQRYLVALNVFGTRTNPETTRIGNRLNRALNPPGSRGTT